MINIIDHYNNNNNFVFIYNETGLREAIRNAPTIAVINNSTLSTRIDLCNKYMIINATHPDVGTFRSGILLKK